MEVDTDHYSVPWRLIGEPVQVNVTDGELRVNHAGREVARDPKLGGRRQVRCLPEHLQGIVGYWPGRVRLQRPACRRSRSDPRTSLWTLDRQRRCPAAARPAGDGQ